VVPRKELANFGIGEGEGFANKVHGDLAGEGHGAAVVPTLEIGDLNAVVMGNEADDVGGGGVALLGEDVVKGSAGGFEGGTRPGEGEKDEDAVEVTLQLAHVFAHPTGEKKDDVVGEIDALSVGFLAKNGAFGLQVRGLDIGHEAPDEAGAQPFLETLDGGRGSIGGEHNLMARLVEGVEGVEEFLLRSLFAGQGVHVVEEEEVDGAVGLAEKGHAAQPNGGDELVDELFGGDVANAGLGPGGGEVVTDGVEEVGLAKAGTAVNEQGVVGLAGILGDGLSSGAGELVGGAGNEGSEGIPGVEGRARRGGGRFGRSLGGGGDGDLDGVASERRGQVLEEGKVVVPDVVGVDWGGGVEVEVTRGAGGGFEGCKPEIKLLRPQVLGEELLEGGPEGVLVTLHSGACGGVRVAHARLDREGAGRVDLPALPAATPVGRGAGP
jgi:hypothetical protein